MKHYEEPTLALFGLNFTPCHISSLFYLHVYLLCSLTFIGPRYEQCSLISTNNYMPGKIRFGSPVVWDMLEYLQVKMLPQDCLSMPKELEILFVINFHISQAIKPATHCSSRISKVDIIWLCMENLQLHISHILAIKNSTAQIYTTLNPHPFQCTFVTRLCTLSLKSLTEERQVFHPSAADSAAQGKASSSLNDWAPAHSWAAMSCSAPSVDADILLLPGEASFQALIMSLALILISNNPQVGLRCLCPSCVPTEWLLPHPPGAAWLPLSWYKGSPASDCPTFARASEAKLLHSCPSPCLLEMSVTVNPQYSVTGKILETYTEQ